MIAPVPTTYDLENDAAQDTSTVVKDFKQEVTQSNESKLKTMLTRWKIAGVVLVLTTVLFLVLSSVYISKTKDYKLKEEVSEIFIEGFKEFAMNSTRCLDNDLTLSGTGHRDLGSCIDYGRFAGAGRNAGAALVNCDYYLRNVGGCDYGCPRSFDRPYYSRSARSWLAGCACNINRYRFYKQGY